MQFNDIFNEQLVERKPNKSDTIKKVGIAAAGVVLVFLALSIQVLQAFLIPILAAVIFGVVFMMRRFNVEYEYVFTNGELDVDKIINKSKRKRALSFHVSNIEVMVPVNNKDYAREVEKFDKLYDFSSGTVQDNTYAAICDTNGQRLKIIIEPNEKMFDAIRAYIPRKIKK